MAAPRCPPPGAPAAQPSPEAVGCSGPPIPRRSFDVVLVGAGIVGLATARALLAERPRSLLVLEAEADVAQHQTGHNSGVLHSGLYYRPGSSKARTCARGRTALVEYCREKGIPFAVCGKLVVATREDQLPALEELERRGRENGLAELERLDPGGLEQRQPGLRAVAGLWVPQTGVVDFAHVARELAADVEERGGVIERRHAFRGARRDGGALAIETEREVLQARLLVCCAGLHADRVARRSGIDPEITILPFRGEYFELRPPARALVRQLIYPVPDPRLPFLGVHLTRRLDGSVEAGPNAVLATHRHGYHWRRVSPRDCLEMLSSPGFWRMAARHWRTGLAEIERSLRSSAFLRALQELLPELRREHLVRGGAGVRAQAVDRRGRLLDDFLFARGPRMVHVLNAPSPAATASLAIAEEILRQARAVEKDGP